MYKDIKSTLHLQDDDDEVGKTDMNGFPLMRKIGIWIDMCRKVNHARFFPGPGEHLALDEMMILATMPNPYFAFMKLKPSVRKGTKLIAVCWSCDGMTYVYDFIMERSLKQLAQPLDGRMTKPVSWFRRW